MYGSLGAIVSGCPPDELVLEEELLELEELELEVLDELELLDELLALLPLFVAPPQAAKPVTRNITAQSEQRRGVRECIAGTLFYGLVN